MYTKQRVLLSINNNSIKRQSCVFTQLNDQSVLLLTIQFSTSHLFALSLNVKSSIRPIDKTLSGATSPDKSRTMSTGNEGVLHIPQSFSI